MGVPNTHKVHCVQAVGQDKVKVTDTSSEMKTSFRLCRVRNDTTAPMDTSTSEQNLPVDNNTEQQEAMNLMVRHWVIVNYEGEEFPGEVTSIEDSDVEVSVMHRNANVWKWPRPEDKILYSRDKVVHQLLQAIEDNLCSNIFSPFMNVCLD